MSVKLDIGVLSCNEGGRCGISDSPFIRVAELALLPCSVCWKSFFVIEENDNYPPFVVVSIFGKQWAEFTLDMISKACFCDQLFPPDNGNMVRGRL